MCVFSLVGTASSNNDMLIVYLYTTPKHCLLGCCLFLFSSPLCLSCYLPARPMKTIKLKARAWLIDWEGRGSDEGAQMSEVEGL